MKKKLLILSTAIALASPLASAVVLNPRGTGQVLLYPYYTVNGGNTTLLTIGNMSDRGKAIKVRFVEGRNGRAVLDFNLYLSPYDVWTAGMFSLDEKGPANLITEDSSCTVPRIQTGMELPSLPGGRHYAPFLNFAYTGANDDAGPNDLSRTREGQIEVIEMGSIVPDSAVAKALIHDDKGIPKDCNLLQNAWLNNGFWTTNSTKDLANPTGGLFGNVQIINVAAGTMLNYNATALEEFRQDPKDIPRGTKNSVVMHGIAGDVIPTLSNSLTDPAKNLASASVMVDSKLIRADYPADKQAIDAVTAVLMANTLSNDFVTAPAMGAQSEWIVTFPTKGFYTDQAIVGDKAVSPFLDVYPKNGDEYHACFGIAKDEFNREQLTSPADICIQLTTPPPGGACPNHVNMCYGVQTLSFTSTASLNGDFLGSTLRASDSRVGGDVFVDSPAGWLRLDVSRYLAWSGGESVPSMRPALDGTIFHGLPAIGFLATNYVNSNVQNGVLANYSGSFPHRTTVKCTKNGNDC